MQNSITACGRCGVSLDAIARFCPSCGRRLATRPRAFYATVVGSGVALFVLGIGLQMAIRGERVMPSARGNIKSPAQVEEQVQDPQMEAMRIELEKSPDDITKLRVFAGVLSDKLRSNPTAPPTIVFEAIDVLGRILKAEPNDPGALVMMADLSFDQRAFTKALDFYERYLKVDPDDLGARSRYASTLTFLGRYDDSISELSKVLKIDPKNFPAMAYLAITYAQRGDVPKAKELGATALSLAPSEEARARFSAFVSSLDGAGQSSASGDSGQNSAESGERNQAPTGVAAFVQQVKSNPVAGPKFARYEESTEGILTLVFRNFPMAQMPPFAKDKFFASLKAAAQKHNLSDVRVISFVDEASGQQMESLVMR